jgi:HlyD family secretion protein
MNKEKIAEALIDSVQLRSEEMQDILTRPPHILVRSGISVICLVVLMLLIGSFFFQYPDKVTGEITITTENPPVWLVAKTGGKIKEMHVKDKNQVREGQLLAVIDNPAKTEDIHQVKALLIPVDITDSSFYLPPGLTGTYELGTVQNAYSVFLKTITDYENFLKYNTLDKEREALQLQIAGHKRYSASLRQQLKLKQEELQLSKNNYDRERQLYDKSVISKAEMEVAENAYLSTRQSYQQLQTNIASDEIESAQLQENLSKLDTQQAREKNNLLSQLKTNYSELKAQIENWEQVYEIISPTNGTVTLTAYWTQNQFVNAGDRVLAIVPDRPGQLIGRIQTPSQNTGKIKTGQNVNIKIQGYPYMEYGTLMGIVRTVSLIANEKIYAVEVDLPQELTTSTGKTLDFTGELTGEAEIITDDRSLADRILAPLKYLLKTYLQD